MKTHYEPCWGCSGSGQEMNAYNGEPTICHVCHGDTVVRARDEKGRFVSHKTPEAVEQPK